MSSAQAAETKGTAAAAATTRAATASSAAAAAHPSRSFWAVVKSAPSARSASGTQPAVQPRQFVGLTLDRGSIAALLATAPAERSSSARQSPLIISLPDPSGGFQRFTVEDSPIMEAGLAAKHPQIRTFAGRGIDDPTASIRMDITQLGFHASVRSKQGAWYIDPYYNLDQSLYASYYGRDLVNPRAPLAEGLLSEPVVNISRGLYRAGDTVQVQAAGFTPGAQVTISVRNPKTDAAARQIIYATASKDGTVSASLTADPYKNIGSYTVTLSDGAVSASGSYAVVNDSATTNAASGSQLRTYRLALLTDPGYANYFGGSANVTAAKATLMNRVTQVYEAETSIRLVLIANNDVLNLDTAAQFSGTNGPCGGTACYSTASVSCTSATLTRTRQVIGLLAGASNFDIGHIAVGAGGGGIASLGVVGGGSKAQGCTGLPTPVGDLFAVDYVAHEMGHQFSGNHTFNGITGSCTGGNRNALTSVEPGSGSSIMAYAGICDSTTTNDDLQPHSDPYWSQKSFDEIVAYTSGTDTNINEVQMAALTGFTTAGGQTFKLRYNGVTSAAIGGATYTTTGVKAAIEALTGGTVTISTLNDTTFTATFSGTLAGTNVANLELVECTGGCTGYIGEVARGGITNRGGTVTPTGNNAPVVTVAGSTYTIPVRTPFALTGNATDVDGDTVTYMWEQTDRGAGTGTGLLSNTKTNGPLFRQFGTRAVVSASDTLLYSSPGENAVNTISTRVFPDLPQILANNTNAETGVCPTPATPATPTGAETDCYSEFLPTAAYVGFTGVNASPLSLNFKLTARDGRGGVNSATTQLQLATGAGPFLVTSPNTAVTYTSGQPQTVSWNVANTNIAPVNTSDVKISLSTDGGNTYPYVLAASTPNTGSASVVMPSVATSQARVKVEALGNVFFDVSNANFTIRLFGDVNGDNAVNCADLTAVRAAFGKSVGQPGYSAAADVNSDGVVDIRDLTLVSRALPTGTACK